MILDETNEDVYVIGENVGIESDRKYIKVDLSDFSAEPLTTVMQGNVDGDYFSNSVGTPTHPVNADTGLMILSKGPDATWWNVLDIR